MSKVIIPNVDGTYGVVEWIENPEGKYIDWKGNQERREQWKAKLAAQPQVKFYQSKEGELNHEWCKSHAYQEIQEGEIEIISKPCNADGFMSVVPSTETTYKCTKCGTVYNQRHNPVFCSYVYQYAQPNHEAVKEDLWEEAESAASAYANTIMIENRVKIDTASGIGTFWELYNRYLKQHYTLTKKNN